MSTYHRRQPRDNPWSDYHYSGPQDFAMIDLDGIPYCRSCGHPVCWVEAVEDRGQSYKPFTVLRAIAQGFRHGVPAFVVWYKAEARGEGICRHCGVRCTTCSPKVLTAITRIQEVWPSLKERGTDWWAIESELRRKHQCVAKEAA